MVYHIRQILLQLLKTAIHWLNSTWLTPTWAGVEYPPGLAYPRGYSISIPIYLLPRKITTDG